jgi:hypothetical protein
MPPDDDLLARLTAARAQAKDLREFTEAMNDRLKLAESVLVSLNLGVQAATPIGDTSSLVFKRHDGAWRLLIVRGGFGEPASEITLPNASRADRVFAANVLGALIDNLLSSMGSELHDVRQASVVLDDLLARVNRG